MINNSKEQVRIQLQYYLDEYKNSEERKRLGQYATPPELAQDIISYSLSLLPTSKKIKFLDPAIGTGSFYSALLMHVADRKIETAVGYEIDEYYGIPTKKLWEDKGLKIEIKDFTEECPDEKYNFLICNPPYVRHQLISREKKLQLNENSRKLTNVSMSGLTGLYCYFILHAVQWLEEDGISGWLIPSEFMDVKYGRELKHFLLCDVTLLRIHRFNPKELQFDDALVSSTLVCFQNKKQTDNYSVEFTYGGTISNPCVSAFINKSTLIAEDKWTRFPCMEERIQFTDQPILSDFFKIKRGIATGNNEFFILTLDEAENLQLPGQLLRPILPSSRYLDNNIIDSDENGNPLVEPKLFLLDCRLDEERIKEQYPLLWLYMQSSVEQVSQGYLCKNRKKWYYQEKREPAPFLCTYMGREKADKTFRFLLNNSRALATNTYLFLYPHTDMKEKIMMNPGLELKIWEVLNDIADESIVNEGRVYGGGLHKIEPRELEKVPALELKEMLKRY